DALIGLSSLTGVSTISAVTEPLVIATRCADDWTAAVAAREAGEASYSGPCAEFGGFDASRDVPEDFYRNEADWQVSAAAEVDTLQTDLWGVTAREIGRLAILLVALLVGGAIPGATLGTGVAAWSISNGTSRRQWAASTVLYVVAAVVAIYAALLIGSTAMVAARIASLGVTTNFVLPGVSALAPLPGALFYAIVAMAVSLVAGRAETGMIAALLLAATEFVLSRIVGDAPLLPSTLHQAAIGSLATSLSPGLASAVLVASGLAVAGATYRWLAMSRDMPSRSA
ncbi:hypothetical protein MNBD_ACTINO02-1325, partial [hydrothermal vent metagenome]